MKKLIIILVFTITTSTSLAQIDLQKVGQFFAWPQEVITEHTEQAEKLIGLFKLQKTDNKIFKNACGGEMKWYVDPDSGYLTVQQKGYLEYERPLYVSFIKANPSSLSYTHDIILYDKESIDDFLNTKRDISDLNVHSLMWFRALNKASSPQEAPAYFNGRLYFFNNTTASTLILGHRSRYGISQHDQDKLNTSRNGPIGLINGIESPCREFHTL